MTAETQIRELLVIARMSNPIREWPTAQEAGSGYSPNAPLPDGLDDLRGFDAVNAERRLAAGGSEFKKRCQAYASILGVDADRLGKQIASLLRRVPQDNRWSHQEELEQAIWVALSRGQDWVMGSWDRTRVAISGAYKDWYTALSNYRQTATAAELRAISLERAYAREMQGGSEAVGYDLADASWVGWEEAVESNADGYNALAALPGDIRDTVERKSNGVPIGRLERNRLSKWLGGGPTKSHPEIPTNKTVLAAMLACTHIGPVEWSKPKR